MSKTARPHWAALLLDLRKGRLHYVETVKSQSPIIWLNSIKAIWADFIIKSRYSFVTITQKTAFLSQIPPYLPKYMPLTRPAFQSIAYKREINMDFDAIMTMMQSETTPLVQIWMNWMVFIFLMSLIFIPKYKSARWAFAVILGTMALAGLVWKMTQNVHLFALPHIILWTPLAVYLWITQLSGAARANRPPPTGLYGKAHRLWVVLLFVTIIISLVFDLRDVFLVITGGK